MAFNKFITIYQPHRDDYNFITTEPFTDLTQAQMLTLWRDKYTISKDGVWVVNVIYNTILHTLSQDITYNHASLLTDELQVMFEEALMALHYQSIRSASGVSPALLDAVERLSEYVLAQRPSMLECMDSHKRFLVKEYLNRSSLRVVT